MFLSAVCDDASMPVLLSPFLPDTRSVDCLSRCFYLLLFVHVKLSVYHVATTVDVILYIISGVV